MCLNTVCLNNQRSLNQHSPCMTDPTHPLPCLLPCRPLQAIDSGCFTEYAQAFCSDKASQDIIPGL